MQPRIDPPSCVSHLAKLDAAARKMRDEDRSALAVVQDRLLVGLISERDLVRRFLASGEDSWFASVGDYMTREVVTCQVGDDPAEILAAMKRAGLDTLPMVDSEMRFIGMVDRQYLEAGDLRQTASLAAVEAKQ